MPRQYHCGFQRALYVTISSILQEMYLSSCTASLSLYEGFKSHTVRSTLNRSTVEGFYPAIPGSSRAKSNSRVENLGN